MADISMSKQDIRWIQRFNNFEKAFVHLDNAINLYKTKGLSDLEKQGMIQSFEFVHELAWKTLKDFLEYQGNQDIKGSRDAIREGFKVSLITNADVWMQMIQTRNQTSHTYDETILAQVVITVADDYYPLFKVFKEEMTRLREKELNEQK